VIGTTGKLRGALLVNLGTPEAPTEEAVRNYLAEFLWDPRVVDVFRPLWWYILHFKILKTRPAESARLYQKVWTDQGSPLMVTGDRQRDMLEEALTVGREDTVPVALAMRYGAPSIHDGLRRLVDMGCGNVVVLPLFPQYSIATTASVQDAMLAALRGWKDAPVCKLVNNYHDHPAYISALAATVREAWEKEPPSDVLLMSFHGTPERYRTKKGDPYFDQCTRTAHQLADKLGLKPGRWQITFQSRFGKEPWLQPYTDETLITFGQRGIRSVDVICPGFAADCLETLEEIAETGRDQFLNAGGKKFRYIPALNDREDHMQALAKVARAHF